MLVIDIETIAQPGLIPPEMEAPANIKDPEKIKAAILKKQDAWLNDAALHADRGMIALMGIRKDGDNILSGTNLISEPDCLQNFWRNIDNIGPIITFNGNRFDIPFLVRRSIILGVKWPHDIFDKRGYLDPNRFIDLLQIWQCGDRQEFVSLDTLSQIILGRKKETSGADFGRLWVEDKQKAIDHLITDLEMTEALAKRMLKTN